jgi:GAF domain-containing protein
MGEKMNSTAILQRLFTLQFNYKDPIERQRAQLLLYILAGGTFIGILFFIQAFVIPIISAVDAPPDSYLGALPVLGNLFTIYLIQTGRLNIASVLSVTTVAIITIVVSLTLSISSTPLFISYLVPMALAVLVFDRWQFNLTAILMLIVVILTGVIDKGSFNELFTGSTGSAILIFVIINFILSVSSDGLNELAKTNQRAIDQYDKVSMYSANMPMVSENQVLGRMLDLVRNELSYAFAQIFLADQRGQITRRFRTGLNLPDGGVYSDIRLADASALVDALRSNMPVTVSTQDSTIRWEHFLPATQYGLILPIQIGEQVIGVLDVQKTDTPFTAIEITTLQHLIKHTATFTIYSRALDDFRSTVDNLRQSVTSLQSQLREYKQTEGDIIGATWMNYLDKRNRDTLGYDIRPEGITLAADLPADIAEALKQDEVDIRIENDVRVVRAPIHIRGEVLGALVFNVPKDRGFGPRQIDFTQSMTARLALALENKRLFEESRSQATREQKANEITSMLLGATDVEDVLKIAVESFNTALGAVATRIQVDQQALELELTQSSESPLLNDGDKVS